MFTLTDIRFVAFAYRNSLLCSATSGTSLHLCIGMLFQKMDTLRTDYMYQCNLPSSCSPFLEMSQTGPYIHTNIMQLWKSLLSSSWLGPKF
jgi:hypothetical protein